MKIILLKDVPKVGRKYETKEVSEGYAANMLLPRGLAIIATASATKMINAEKAKLEGEKKIHSELLIQTLSSLDGKVITLTEKVNEKGHLFKGIHKPEILAAIKDQTRLELYDEHIILDKPIKESGDHTIKLKGAGKTVEIVVSIKTPQPSKTIQ